MSMVERRHRRGRRGSNGAGDVQVRRPLFRWVAAGSAALFLMSSAYQASWGQGNDDDYVGRGDDDGDAKETALIAVGAAVGAGLLWLLLFGGDDDDGGVADEDAAYASRKIPGGKTLSDVRLVPQKKVVAAGEQCAFDLQVRAANGKWQSVTGEAGASIEVSSDSGLVRQDGAKNVFLMPLTAAQTGEATVVGRFTRPGAEPVSVTTTVQVGASG